MPDIIAIGVNWKMKFSEPEVSGVFPGSKNKSGTMEYDLEYRPKVVSP